MPSRDSIFTPLERAVLAEICRLHPDDQHMLESQLSAATFRSRENTGCGFLTCFVVDRAASTELPGLRLRNGPAARVEGLEHGMGFILWLKEGYADCLEGYCFGESTTSIALEKAGFTVAKETDGGSPSKI